VTGFLNGDTSSVLSGSPVETTKAVDGSLPGTYPIAIAQGTLAATNYSFTLKNGTLTILSKGTAATPVFSPGAGTYSSVQKVTITDPTPGATIYYAINGTPTASSTKYAGAITVSASETLEAIATAPNYVQSPVAKAAYTMKIPVATLSASKVAFGNQTVNTASAIKSVTLTNTGNGTLNIANIDLTGANLTSFFMVDNCGTSVAAGANCNIWLLFYPAAKGAETAAVTITDNAAGSPQSIALSGTGQ
jgi:hypothetical protein